jgi:hypothetical protein
MPRHRDPICGQCSELLLLDPDTNSLACPNCSEVDGDTFAARTRAARLLVPARATSGAVTGDGLLEIGPDDPNYAAWAAWFRQQR